MPARTKKKRTYGTRSTGGLLIYGPEQLASLVIGSYTSQARQEAPTWSTNYLSGVNEYITSEQKVRMAQRKLALWYQALNEFRNEIKRAYEAAGARYAELLSTLVTPVVTPAAARAPAPTPAPRPAAGAIPAP